MNRGDRREPIFKNKDDADRKRSQRTTARKFRFGTPGAASSRGTPPLCAGAKNDKSTF